MKFKGKQLDRKTSVAKQRCLLPRYGTDPLQLIVAALPLTFNQLALKLLPEPIAPLKLMTDNSTGKLVMGPDRKPIQYNDENDSGYKELNFKRAQRLNAWMVFEALQFEDELEWTASIPEKQTRQSIAAWLDELNLEMESAGFSNGDIMLIIEQSMKLSNMTIEDIESERESFLSKELQAKQRDGNCQSLQEEQLITQSIEQLKD